MKYKVNLSYSAEEDLFEIYQYVFFNNSAEIAEKLHSKLYEKCIDLQEFSHQNYH